MLQSLRNYTQSWAFKGLLIILLFSFAVWGIGDIFTSRHAEPTVAEVGNSKITATEVRLDFNAESRRLGQMMQQPMTPALAISMGLLDRVVKSAIQRNLLDYAAKDLGIHVDENLIIQNLSAQSFLQDANGKLDPDRFRQLLQGLQQTEAQFLRTQAQELARELALQPLLNAVQAPKSMAAISWRIDNEQRTPEVVTIEHNKLPLPAEPDIATLQEFHQQNPQLFTAPAYRAVNVLTFDIDKLAADIAVGQDELRERYEASQSSMTQPATRSIKQVVFETQAEAEKISAEARKAGSLTKVAKNVVTLDDTTREGLTEDLRAAAFSLAKDEISEPLQSAFGWHVLQITKITPAKTLSLAEASPQLTRDIRREKSGHLLDEMNKRVLDALAGGASFEQIAEQEGLVLGRYERIDANGHDANDKPMPLFADNENLRAQLQALQAGEDSDFITLPNGNMLVLRVQDVIEPSLRDFATVRGPVLTAWQKNEQRKNAIEKANAVKAALDAGESLAAVSKKLNVLGEKLPALTRTDGTPPQLTSDLKKSIFALKRGEAAMGGDDTRQIIVRLAEIKAVNKNDALDKASLLRDGLTERLRFDIGEQYLTALENDYPVTLHQDVLARVVTLDDNTQ